MIIVVSTPYGEEITLEVSAHTDFESQFTGACVDTGADISVCGWACDIEIIGYLSEV